MTHLQAIDVLDQAASMARLQEAEGYRGCVHLEMRRVAIGKEWQIAQFNSVPALVRKVRTS